MDWQLWQTMDSAAEFFLVVSFSLLFHNWEENITLYYFYAWEGSKGIFLLCIARLPLDNGTKKRRFCIYFFASISLSAQAFLSFPFFPLCSVHLFFFLFLFLFFSLHSYWMFLRHLDLFAPLFVCCRGSFGWHSRFILHF